MDRSHHLQRRYIPENSPCITTTKITLVIQLCKIYTGLGFIVKKDIGYFHNTPGVMSLFQQTFFATSHDLYTFQVIRAIYTLVSLENRESFDVHNQIQISIVPESVMS